ncbi:MAG TPA: PSD1 and planctomycete cytochrome C domain-containing protein [Bryobacteraceae bacterium]|nr:PSD1 and planctomycete cytochrome C domain-containing protein [Bryobacteraceae bacterium]
MLTSLRFAAAVVLGGSALSASADEALFEEKLKPVLIARCAQCHNGTGGQSGLSVNTLPDLLKGGKRGPALQPGRAGASLIVQFARGELNPRMPIGAPPLPESEVVAMAAAIDAMKPLQQTSSAADGHSKWIFSPASAPDIPPVKNSRWVRNPIDAFVLSRLEAKGMSPAPPAAKRALLRRVYFDLIGLPPSVEESEAFLKDESPDAFEKLVDKLLADKRYGERWARHWLDLVRFAESDGFAVDSERPTAWRYRDYVIRAFNADKPYDLFVQEQLAGDEMDRKRLPRGITMEANDGPIALGYLRMGPWEQDANFDDQLRLDWLNEMTTTTSQVFLGLTVGCARCHDHKYDPIPQRDFYRMQAFFASTRVDDRPAPFLEAEDPHRMRQILRKREDDVDKLTAELKVMEQSLRHKFDAAPRQPTKGGGDEDPFALALADKEDPVFTRSERKAYTDLLAELRRTTAEMQRYRPVAYSVNEVAPPAVLEIAPTYVLSGGELAAKGERVEPGVLRCVTGKEEPLKIPFSGRYRSGRRRALAEWITSPDNPLTARVMVNRIWQHHFGEGIVRTASDFGLNGDRPSHQELLDWLATQFVAGKWSIKAMHRLMLTSNAYRQSTSHPEWKKLTDADTENRLLWRMNWLRLESEVLRDSMLALSGRLNTESGGPGMFFSVSDEVAKGFEMFKWYPSDEAQQRRRSIYAFQRRSLMMPMMEVFDGANMSESCARRSTTTVAPQALTLLNGTLTAAESAYFAERVLDIAGEDRDRQIERAFSLVLARGPAPEELASARQLYRDRKPKEALTRLATVLFNLNEFLYLE